MGIEIEGIERALSVLRKLRRERRARFYYTEFNILEILGKISKVEYDRNIVATGLSLVKEEFELIHPTVEGYMKALSLRRKGFKDLIDLLLYTTSLTHNLLFLTRDIILFNFLKNLGEEIGNILLEKDLIEKYL